METFLYHMLIVMVSSASVCATGSVNLTSLRLTSSQTDQYTLECDSDVSTPGGRIIFWFRNGTEIFQTEEQPKSSCRVTTSNVSNIIDGSIDFNCTSTSHIVTFRLSSGADDGSEWWCEETAEGQSRTSSPLRLGSTTIESSSRKTLPTGSASTGVDASGTSTGSTTIASSSGNRSSTGSTSTRVGVSGTSTRSAAMASSTGERSSTGRTSTGADVTGTSTGSTTIASSSGNRSSTGRTSTGADVTGTSTGSTTIASSSGNRSSTGRTSTGVDVTGTSTRSAAIASSTGERSSTDRTSTGADVTGTSTGSTTIASSTENSSDLVYAIVGSVWGIVVAAIAVAIVVYVCRKRGEREMEDDLPMNSNEEPPPEHSPSIESTHKGRSNSFENRIYNIH
ncbi:uncharacterized protein [Haliotis asinina]|uniref:uncharacterized protein n=1 Tax=Haliotis asinina TaxID=109174 RepID=UPI003531EFA4